MRRLSALLLFALGYWLIALLSPAVAAAPAFFTFAAAAMVLLRATGSPAALARASRKDAVKPPARPRGTPRAVG